jgi:hypothetical protein
MTCQLSRERADTPARRKQPALLRQITVSLLHTLVVFNELLAKIRAVALYNKVSSSHCPFTKPE